MAPGHWLPDWVACGPGFWARTLWRYGSIYRAPDRVRALSGRPTRFGLRRSAPGPPGSCWLARLPDRTWMGFRWARRQVQQQVENEFARPRLGSGSTAKGPAILSMCWARVDGSGRCRSIKSLIVDHSIRLRAGSSTAQDPRSAAEFPVRCRPGRRAGAIARADTRGPEIRRRRAYSRASSRAITTRWIWFVPS